MKVSDEDVRGALLEVINAWADRVDYEVLEKDRMELVDIFFELMKKAKAAWEEKK